MKIELWSDFACPFCYIGKKRFEQALNEFEFKDDVEVIFRSFILDPNAPKSTNLNGVEQLAQSKGISVEQARSMYDNVVKMAKTENLDYNLDILKPTSTLDAHYIMQWGKQFNKEQELTEKFFEGYFTKGVDLSNLDSLLDIVESVGLDPEKARESLELGLFEDDVINDIREANKLGVSSVPTFVIDREFGFSGAQKKEHFLNFIKESYKKNNNIKFNTDGTACGIDGCDI